MKHTVAASLILSLLSLPLAAQTGSDHGAMQTPIHAAAAAPMSEGVIKKVDKAAGKLTLTHGPLVNLDMPAMTMVFRVTDPAWLNQMKTGDKIRFVADKVGGAYTVVEFEPVR